MKERAAAKTIVEAVSVLESISLAGVTMAVSSRGLGQHLCTGKLVWQSPLKKKKKETRARVPIIGVPYSPATQLKGSVMDRMEVSGFHLEQCRFYTGCGTVDLLLTFT